MGSDGPYHRYAVGDGRPGQIVELLYEPDRAAGSWGFGAGTAHHVAFQVDSDEALIEQKAMYEELGYTDASEIKDRYYFHSMYVRAPGGILIECTANVAGGFCLDEAADELGARLHLPPWYEEQRGDILSRLEPVVIPDECRPRRGDVRSAPVHTRDVRAPDIAFSRTKAAFSPGSRDR